MKSNKNTKRGIKRYNLDTSNRIHYEDLREVQRSVFENVYRTADKTLYKIVEDESKYGKNESRDESSLNVISFLGERGRGKTSAMLSFLSYINKLQIECEWSELYKQKQGKRIEFVTMPYIDAAMLAEKEYIFDVILAEMWDKFEEEVQRLVRNTGTDYLGNLEEQIKRTFISVRRAYLDMKERESTSVKGGSRDIPVAGALHDLATSVNLNREMRKLVKLYLNFFCKNGGEKEKDAYLVITVDDVDMSGDKAYNVLEQIRRFLRISHVIILITADINRLQLACESRYRGIYEENDRAHFINEYLEKVLPYNMRVYMPELQERHLDIFIETQVKERLGLRRNTEKDMILEFWAQNCGVYFDGSRKRRHFLQNQSIRSMVNYFEQLMRINDMDYYRIMWLRIDLKERLAERVHDLKHKHFIMELLQSDYEDINRKCIDYMTHYLEDNDYELLGASDNNIGCVLYLCSQMTRFSISNSDFVNCILMFYTIVLKQVDEELKRKIIGDSVFGHWEYSAVGNRLRGQGPDCIAFSNKMTLEIELPEGIEKVIGTKERIEKILDVNKNVIVAWLFIWMYVRESWWAEEEKYTCSSKKKTIQVNEGKEEKEVIQIIPKCSAKKNYFSSSLLKCAERENLKEKLLDVVEALQNYLVNEKENNGLLEKEETDLICEKFYADNIKVNSASIQKDLILIIGPEIIYNIGQILETVYISDISPVNDTYEMLLKKNKIIIEELERVDRYYIGLGKNPNYAREYKQSMQNMVLTGKVEMAKEAQEEFRERMTRLLTEIQGTILGIPQI